MAVSEYRVAIDGEVTVERSGTVNKFSLADAVTVLRDEDDEIVGIKGPDGEEIVVSGGGGGAATNISITAAPTTITVVSSTGSDGTISAADGTNAGLMLPAEKTKLSGIATGATANSSDATLLARGNHTGTQAISTVSGLQGALDAKLDASALSYPVTSVASKTGAVTLVKADVGLGNVDNTSDANKPVSTATQTALDAKQATLVSGTNIKTINSTSILGSGNITVTATAAWGAITGTLADQTDLNSALSGKQATLVSGTNIKTINGTTVLGSGDITISGTAAWGGITGTLSSQTDLQTALDGKEAVLTIGTTISASRDLTSADVNKMFTVDTSGGAVALTLVSGVFSGTTSKKIMFRRSGAGALTFVQGSGTTLSNPLSISVANGDLVGLASSEANVATVVGSDANAARTNVTNTFTKAQAVTPVALTDGATITPDAQYLNHRLTIAGTGRTLANPTGGTDGQGLNIRIQQDATGSRTITTYGSKYKFSGGTLPTLTSAANSVDYLSCRYDATSDTWMCSFISDIK